MTQTGLGRLTGIDQSLLCKYINGKRRPGLENALRIERATQGAVSVEAWEAIPAYGSAGGGAARKAKKARRRRRAQARRSL